MENYSKQLEYTEKTTTGTTFPSLYKKNGNGVPIRLEPWLF